MTTATSLGSRLLPRTLVGRRTLTGYIFIMPFILGFLIWFLIPALIAVWLTFTDWNLIAPPSFVGLDNIKQLGEDKLFWLSLWVTTKYTLISVPLGLVLGFILALLMNTNVRGITFLRTIYYLPSIVPAVANAVLWAWIFNTEFGLLNALFHYIGLSKVKWLQEPAFALNAADFDEPLGVWQQHDHLPSRIERHPRSLLRGSQDRRRWPLGTITPHHNPTRVAGNLFQLDHWHHRLLSGLHRWLYDHQRRPPEFDALLCALSLSQRVSIFKDGLCRSVVLGALYHHYGINAVRL